MQDPKTSQTRTTSKRWYERAIEMASLWRSVSKSSEERGNLVSKSSSGDNNNNNQRLRKCTSLKVATSFTRVCLCAPISSYAEVNVNPPRRSNTYPRSKPASLSPSPSHSARHSTEVRRIFRGKSLTDDVLMRRFVVEEEAMMQVRRRNEMEAIRKRSIMRRKRLGPSPLCRMVMAQPQHHH